MSVDLVTDRLQDIRRPNVGGQFRFVLLFLTVGVLPPIIYLNRPLHVDESVFLLVGQELRHGATLYADVIDHKPPGIFLLSAAFAWLPGEQYHVARMATYLANAITAVAITVLGRQVRDQWTGLVGGLLFLVGVYLPHFDGFYFLTEPFCILFMTIAASLLLVDNRICDTVAGALLGVAVLFNQTVFLMGVSIMALYGLGLRYHWPDRRAYVIEVIGRFAWIGIGFSVPLVGAGTYLASEGVLPALLHYVIYLPLTSYHTPFVLKGHVLAFVSYLPVWLLTGGAILVAAYRYRVGERIETGYLLLVTWFIVLVIPGAIGFNGDHKLLFAFPPAALLASMALTDLSRMRDINPDVVRGAVDAGAVRAMVGTGVVALSVVLVLSVGTNGMYALVLMDDSIDDQIAATDQVNETVDGAVYTFPFDQAVVYLNEDLKPGNAYLGSIYGESLARETIDTLESENVRYVLVAQYLVAEDHSIRGETGFFPESRKTVADYIEREYEYLTETEQYVIFRRK